jgi:hypothetical protein
MQNVAGLADFELDLRPRTAALGCVIPVIKASSL